MALKILQGEAKALALEAPAIGTRPTSVLLRRKIFDAHQDMKATVFIDCCAGTGAMGLEAASRGANKVVFIEPSRVALKALKKNIQMFEQRVPHSELLVHVKKCQTWLEKNGRELNSNQSVLFLDPPYEQRQIYLDVLDLLKELEWRGELWLESDRQKGIQLEELECLEFLGEARRVYKQGTSFIATWSFG